MNGSTNTGMTLENIIDLPRSQCISAVQPLSSINSVQFNSKFDEVLHLVYEPGGSSGKALGFGLDGPGSIQGVEGVEIFFTPSCLDWSWGPLNLL